MRLVHRLFVRITAYGRQEQYVASQSYDYDLEIGSYDFWEYYIAPAAHAHYAVNRRIIVG